MKNTYIYSNWKMYLNDEQSESLLKSILLFFQSVNTENTSINHDHMLNFGFFPQTSCLMSLHKMIANCTSIPKNFNLTLGCQNIHHENSGAFTGETSINSIKPYCESVLTGHSERRIIFGETNANINKKTILINESLLEPVICVGEPEHLSKHAAEEFLRSQILSSIEGLNISNHLIFAYEPLGSIGTGIASNSKTVNSKAKFIKEILIDNDPTLNLEKIRVLYGGSVSDKNINDYLSLDHIDGVLIGSSSVDLEKFKMIVNKVTTQIHL